MPIEKSKLAHAITAHFNALKTQSIEVPEWGENGLPALLYFDPVTVGERIELEQYEEDYLVRVLIKKACLPDGTPAFTLADRALLLHGASAAVVSRIANRILVADSLDPKLTGSFRRRARQRRPLKCGLSD